MARLAPTYEQACAYCHQDFVPVKRGTQRFCSASCRTTHCKKKKAGTLGRVTKLTGPPRGGAPQSFAGTALAAAMGALAANTVTQTAEYFAVTKGLVAQVDQLTRQLQQLQAAHAASAARLEADVRKAGRGVLTLLTRLGMTNAEAWAAIDKPFSAPLTAAPRALPAPSAAALPGPGPVPFGEERVPAEQPQPLPTAPPRERSLPPHP